MFGLVPFNNGAYGKEEREGKDIGRRKGEKEGRGRRMREEEDGKKKRRVVERNESIVPRKQ